MPYLNYALIIVNMFFFFITYSPHYTIIAGTRVLEPLRLWAEPFMLTPVRPYLWQFISYAFLHGSLAHVIGNMYFLYLFGNNVNDKLGNFGYLCLYLGGAVFAGIGHTLFHSSPVLGASGAVAAVTGAYLVLFPQTLITVLYWFIFIGTMELSALYFILFKLIVWDNIFEPRLSPASVAYDAHLAGYAFGIVAVLALLATGLISSSHFDLWTMIKRWNQKRRYRDVVSSSYDPYTGTVKARKIIKVKEVKKTTAQRENEEKIKQLRTEISSLIAQKNLAAAAEKYLDLIGADSDQIPPRQYLLDIANQLASDNKHTEAANAYEKFLTHYKNYEYAEQVELMVGLLYSRYLHQSQLAIKHLQNAAKKLTDPGQVKMCQDELAKLQG